MRERSVKVPAHRGPTRASPLRGRYLITHRAWNLALRVTDGALALLRAGAVAASPRPPRRLLLALGGHMGDAVIATRALAVARSRFPDAEIGVLAGSWARPVLAGHPHVRWLHLVDHWKLNRGGAGRVRNFRRYWETARAAVKEIREVGYDTVVDLYPYFPNSAFLVWYSAVPTRVGYRSGGLGPLYTHALEWDDSDRHISDYAIDLLKLLPAQREEPESPVPSLAPPTASALAGAKSVLDAASLQAGSFVLLHVGSGSPLKMWPLENWITLAGELVARGLPLALTGVGENERRDAQRVVDEVGSGANLCGELDWEAYVQVVSRARLVVCADSVAGHVASAMGTPCVVLMSGMSSASHWRPLGSAAWVATNPVSCSPCFRSRGCASMACVKGLGVSEVLAMVDRALDHDQAALALGTAAARMR